MDIPDMQELAAHLDVFTIANQADLQTAVAALHQAMDVAEQVAAAKFDATAQLREQLALANQPYDAPMEAASALVAAAKAALVRYLEAHESAARAAVQARQPVPAPLERPRGLQVKTKLELINAYVDLLPDEYLIYVPDSDAILSAVERGESVPGAETRTVTSVSYRRPSK